MQFSDFNFDRIDFFDVTGTWTCPLDVNEIILVGSGGGGGGSGGGYVGNGVGNPGSAGGDTTMTGTGFTTQTFTGGAGGVANGQYDSRGGGNGNGFGRGPSGHAPSSGGAQADCPGGNWATQMPILGNLNCFFFPGGRGAGTRAYADVSAAPKYICEGPQAGGLANGGTGWVGNYTPVAAGAWGGAGAGGAAFGVFRRVKVTPGRVYTLTIGSGGGGAPAYFSTSAAGGGGSGGFLAMIYNQNAQNAA